MKHITNSFSTLKKSLEAKIPPNLERLIPRGFEIVGTIAILEIREELVTYETLIAQTLLDLNSHILTVVKKASIHEGEFRTQSFEILAGEQTTTTQYRENGVMIELDINSTYFSTKLSTEREILAKYVQPQTNQLVLFSGAGPYTFVISKHKPNISRITSIELNPHAHTYALKNLEHNKNNLKQSDIFKRILATCKEHSIPFYDKSILKSLNYLTYSFFNIDALQYNPSINGPPHTNHHDIHKDDNSLFNNTLFELFKQSKQESQHLTINLDTISQKERENVLYYLVFNPFSITFTILYNSAIYLVSTQLEKNYLYQLLTQPYKSIKQIYKYDEVYMPLPKTAKEFLPHVLTLTNPQAVIHLYDFMMEEEIEKQLNASITDEIIQIGEEHNKKLNILSIRKVGQASPRKYRVCIDIKVEN
ncbi:MAG: hypothetical protein ACLFPL_02715 [Candidatus Nanoarchaeia archaeon]